MTTIRKVQSMFGLAILAALVAPAFSASADEPPPPPEDAVHEEDYDQPYVPYIPPGSLRCTMSGATESGREWGAIYMTSKWGVCRRIRVGGPAPVDFPSCHERGRNELGCQLVID